MPQEPRARIFSLVGSIAVLACLVAGAVWLDMQNDRSVGQEARRARGGYVVEPATVEDWMTFDYLNAVFSLPPSYLKDALQIQDPRYPALSLRQYAESRGTDPAAFLGEVRIALMELPAASSTRP